MPYFTVRKIFTTTLVLTVPNGGEGLTSYTDVCGIGLGAVLMKHGKVIAYASLHLNNHEKKLCNARFGVIGGNICSKDVETPSLGDKFELYMNHTSFKYLFTQKDLNLRQHRWL